MKRTTIRRVIFRRRFPAPPDSRTASRELRLELFELPFGGGMLRFVQTDYRHNNGRPGLRFESSSSIDVPAAWALDLAEVLRGLGEASQSQRRAAVSQPKVRRETRDTAARAAQRAEAHRLRAEGRTIEEIRAALGIGRATVFRLLKEPAEPTRQGQAELLQ